MARCFGECSVQCHRKITVERRVQSVVEHVENAERLIARARDEKAAQARNENLSLQTTSV